MEDFEKRLIIERDDLRDKTSKLLIFIGSDRFKTIDKESQMLLQFQYGYMISYLSVLNKRIERLNL